MRFRPIHVLVYIEYRVYQRHSKEKIDEEHGVFFILGPSGGGAATPTSSDTLSRGWLISAPYPTHAS